MIWKRCLPNNIAYCDVFCRMSISLLRGKTNGDQICVYVCGVSWSPIIMPACTTITRANLRNDVAFCGKCFLERFYSRRSQWYFDTAEADMQQTYRLDFIFFIRLVVNWNTCSYYFLWETDSNISFKEATINTFFPFTYLRLQPLLSIVFFKIFPT